MAEAREKKILTIFDSHMQKIVETVAGMDKAVQGFYDMDEKKVCEGFEEAFKKEREADEIKRQILNELSKGIFHPINRSEIIRMVLTADEIAANAKAAARKLSYVDSKKVHMELRQIIKDFSKELINITKLTYDTFLALMEDPKSATELSSEVERLEEKIDDLRSEQLIPETLVWYRRINEIGSSLVLKEATDNMENVADFCESVADIIRAIALSHV
jgi:predicted phosphate transport protein (TIGR00153 family)